MKTILIAGLGNPGKKYEKTRHNAGFMFVDYFWKEFQEEFALSNWEFKKNLNAEISKGKCKEKKIILLKPQTFMNLSGEAIGKVLKYYKFKSPLIPLLQRGKTSSLLFENGEPERDFLIVAHDDIDLVLGKYKISQNSSSAGHNGAQNIIDVLGTKDFSRIRIGVENREDRTKPPTEKYALGKFGKEEMQIMKEIMSKASEEVLEKYIF